MTFTDSAAQPQQDQSGTPQQTPVDFSQHSQLLKWVASPNIAEDLDITVLSDIGQRVKLEYDIDDRSREDWKTKIKDAIELAMQVSKEKQYPWPKAANVIYPIMTTAAMQFAARAYPAIIAGRDVVKGLVIGNDDGVPMMGVNGQPMMDPNTGSPVWRQPPGIELQRATRIADHMSWQLLDEMTEWESDMDVLLHLLPIAGCVFKKSYFDPGKGRNMSVAITPLKVVINYYAKSLETTPRITEEIEFYPLEIIEMERAGIWRHVEYTNEPESGEDKDAPRHFLEQHRYWDLDGDGYAEPYIVTIHKESTQVVRIRARYEAEGVVFDAKNGHKVRKIDPVHYYTKYDFLPNPDGGIYGIGFGTLLKPVNEAVNTTLNQIIDAGHLSIVGGGFIGRGLSMNSGAVRFSPGEYKMVNVPGSTIKDNIVPLPFPGPSMVLFQLLGMLIEAGKDIAAVKDVLTGEQQQHNVPATTTLALIEQGLKVFTGIYKRVHRSLKEELKKLYRLNSIYLEEETAYQVGNSWKQIQRDDYAKGAGVEPISDPTMVSDMQRLGKAQYLQQFMQDPYVDGMELRMRMFGAAQIEKPEKLLHQPPPNPALAIKGMEMDMKAKRDQASELREMAQAILYFAQADKVVGDMHIDWVNAKLAQFKMQFEAAMGGQQGGGADGQPPPQSPHPHPEGMAPGPSDLHPGAAPESGPTSPVAGNVQGQLTGAGMPSGGPPLNHQAHAAWRGGR